MYRVIKYFTDLQDNNHAYQVGDIFPHEGKEVTEKRLLELSTSANRRGMPLIEKVEETEVAKEVEEVEKTEPVEDFMNPPEEPIEEEDNEKPKKRRGRPRNDAE
jgi:hypothetical protein